MKLAGMIGTGVLSLTLGATALAYPQQEQHDQQEENKDRPAQEKEKKAQPEQSAKPAEKNARQEEKGAKPEEKNAQEQHAQQSKPQQKQVARGRPHSRRPLQGQFRTRTSLPGQRKRLPQSPLPIWRLLVRFRRRVAEQLALHAGCLRCRNRRRVLPVQCELSGRKPDAQRHALA